MASDLISRDDLLKELGESVNWLRKIYVELKGKNGKSICNAEIATFNDAIMRVNQAPAVDAVEVVRCKDCVYWRDRHVLTPDGQRKSYAEMPPEAFSEIGIAIGGVTCEYGINCGSRCELELDSGYGVDKSVFREAGDFCSRGAKKDAD